MGVEILIQDLCGLFAEVASFAPDETQTGGMFSDYILFNKTHQ